MIAKEIILYDSPEIVTQKEVTVWVSKNNKFFLTEDSARYDSCTHKTCGCGNLMEKYYTLCNICRSAKNRQRYLDKPFEEYDGSPVVLYDGDVFFFEEDDIIEYCEENSITEVDLLFCKEQKWTYLDSDYWESIIPEEMDYIPVNLQEAINNVNKVIDNLPPCSYAPGDIRTTYSLKDEFKVKFKYPNAILVKYKVRAGSDKTYYKVLSDSTNKEILGTSDTEISAWREAAEKLNV